METTIREGYVRKSKVLWKSMKKRYLVLRSSSEQSRTGQLEFYDDHKQVKKKPTNVISLTLITCVKRIETPPSSGACQKDGHYFIRLDIMTERDGQEELFLGIETKDQFDDWLSDLEFLVRLPNLIIPLSILPKRELPLTKQTNISKSIFGSIEFEDACPVEVLKTEIGIKWQFNNRFFILVLTRSTLLFLDPETGLRALTYPIKNLRRCGHWQKLLFVESGRRTDTGPGYLWMFVHSKVLAKNFYSTLSNVMGSSHPLLVTQRYLCWDKYREELPPGSIDLLSDTGNLFQAPIVDNENYFGTDVFDRTPVKTELPQPVNYLNNPPLPPNHPVPMEHLPTNHPVPMEHLPPKYPVPMEHLPPKYPVPMEHLPPKYPVPMEHLPPKYPVPMEHLPPKYPVPMEHLPPKYPVPMEHLPTNYPVPMEHLPLNHPVPMEHLPLNHPVPMEHLPLNHPVPMEHLPLNHPVPMEHLPLNHPVPMELLPTAVPTGVPTPHKSATLSRKEESQLPPLPVGEDKRRASLPGADLWAADRSELGPDRSNGVLPKQKSLTVSGIGLMKKRYDILVIDDTQDLKVGENGQVVTKIMHAVTDGKGNVVKQQPTPPSHSYYDVNELISKLTVSKKNSPSLGRKNAKLNTISTKKLSNTSAKEKIGNSTFYKGSLPTNNPNIAPYAEFSDLESQIPADVRKERLRLLSTKWTQSMENPTDTGSPLPSHTAVMPQTPLLYASPKNFPVDSVYNLVNPLPRPAPTIHSSRSLPEDLTPEENVIYNVPTNSDYQSPDKNSEVHFPPSTASTAHHDHENAVIITAYDGDYDRLAEAARDSLDLLASEQTESSTCRNSSPCYERMESLRNGLSESGTKRDVGDNDDVTFLMQPDTSQIKHTLDTLVESQVLESPMTQDNITLASQEPEDKQDEPRDLYEVMVDTRREDSNPNPPNSRYFNIPPPQQTNTTPKEPAFLRKLKSSPHLIQQQKPRLNKEAKSFSFKTQSSLDGNMYYADLELNRDKRDATVIINSDNNSPPTHYDKIDHKVSTILHKTVQQHREKQY